MTNSEVEFRVGETLECIDSHPASGLEQGSYIVDRWDGNYLHVKGSNGRVTGGWDPGRFRRAPARPPTAGTGGWVPKVGDRVRVIRGLDTGGTFTVKAVGLGMGQVAEIEAPRGHHIRHYDTLEPAPAPAAAMPEGKAGKSILMTEEVRALKEAADYSYRTAIEGQWLDTEPRRPNAALDARPMPALHPSEAILDGDRAQRRLSTLVWDCDKYHGLDAATYMQLSNLDKRIAVARAELDQPTAERRARLSRFDPTPWQDWPKGWDDEP